VLPDLIILDGGKGQLSSVLDIMQEFDFDVKTIGLAKREEEIFEKIWDEDLKSYRFRRIILTMNSESLFLIQRIRYEEHRFAITYFRGLHQKNTKKSALEEIKGIGPKTRRKLLKEFGSVKGIREAELADIKKITGKKLAVKIKEVL